MSKNLINESAYNEITQQGKVVVQFTANWCGPCKSIKPLLEGNSSTFGYDYKLVNIEDESEFAKKKGIRSIPFVEIYSGGEKKHEFTGAKTPSQLKELFESLF